MTDVAILETLTPVAPTEIHWKPDITLPFHPNGMKFEGFDAEGRLLDTYTVLPRQPDHRHHASYP